MDQVGGCCCGVVLPPEFDGVRALGGGILEGGQRLVKGGPLLLDQWEGRHAGPVEEHEFEEELDAKVSDVFHRLREPGHQVSSAAGGDAVDDPLWPGVSRFDAHRFGESGFDETAECPVHEGLSNGEYLAHGAVGFQVLCDGETVGRAFGEETEYDVFGF